MTPITERPFRRSTAHALVGGALVVCLTYVWYRLQLDVATAALLNLIAVVLLSLIGTFVSSALVSLAAALSLHYFFIAPAFSWWLDDPLDMAALAAFLTTALIVTRLLSKVRQSLREAQRAQEELRLAIDTIPALVWSTRPDGSDEFSNQRWLEYTGLSRDDAHDWGFTAAIHPDDYERLLPHWSESFKDGVPIEDEARLRRSDGVYRWFLQRAVPLRDGLGRIVKWYGTSTDIDDRKQAEEAAQRAQTQLRRVRERALRTRFAAVLDERTRLAREIHDTLLQGFTGIALKLVAVANQLSGSPEASAALRDVIALAQKTLGDARRAVWDLRTPPTNEGDFATGLRRLAEESVRGTGLTLEFKVEGVPRAIDADVEAAAVRVVQESISNIVKHAGAQRVRVGLFFDARRLRLSVRDDGRGFTVEPNLQAYGGHWGLLGMRERATQLHGVLKVRSTPGRGTDIVLLVPATTP